MSSSDFRRQNISASVKKLLPATNILGQCQEVTSGDKISRPVSRSYFQRQIFSASVKKWLPATKYLVQRQEITILIQRKVTSSLTYSQPASRITGRFRYFQKQISSSSDNFLLVLCLLTCYIPITFCSCFPFKVPENLTLYSCLFFQLRKRCKFSTSRWSPRWRPTRWPTMSSSGSGSRRKWLVRYTPPPPLPRSWLECLDFRRLVS